VEFHTRLNALSASRLGRILKDLTGTGKDLSDIFEDNSVVHRG